MVSSRSEARADRLVALGAAGLGLATLLVGFAAMGVGARLGAGIDFKLALLGGELALAAPGVLGLLLLRALLGPAAVRIGRPEAGWALVALGFGGALWLASLGLVGAQHLVWPPPAGYLEQFAGIHARLRPDGVVSAVAALGAIALGPALAEELVFRGVVQPSLRPLLGPPGALLGAALLFGIIHLDDTAAGVTAWRVPFAVGVGLGLGALRERSGLLWPCVVAHCGLNALTWSLVALSGSDVDSATPGPAAAFATLLVGVAAVAGVLVRWRPAATTRRLE